MRLCGLHLKKHLRGYLSKMRDCGLVDLWQNGVCNLMDHAFLQAPNPTAVRGVDDDTIAGVPAHAIVNDSGSLASKAKTYAPAFAVDHSGADFAKAHNHARIGYVRDFIK